MQLLSSTVMQTVQLSIQDAAYAAGVREALCRSCACHVEMADSPDPSRNSVLVLDEAAFEKLLLPVSNPERVVLVARQGNRDILAQAWEAGIVSVVSADDPMNTVLLAIMAAALRVAKFHGGAAHSEISPNPETAHGPIAPENRSSGSKR